MGKLLARNGYWGTFWGAPVAGAGREGGVIPVMGAQGEAIPVMGAFGGTLWWTA